MSPFLPLKPGFCEKNTKGPSLCVMRFVEVTVWLRKSENLAE